MAQDPEAFKTQFPTLAETTTLLEAQWDKERSVKHHHRIASEPLTKDERLTAERLLKRYRHSNNIFDAVWAYWENGLAYERLSKNVSLLVKDAPQGGGRFIFATIEKLDELDAQRPNDENEDKGPNERRTNQRGIGRVPPKDNLSRQEGDIEDDSKYDCDVEYN